VKGHRRHLLWIVALGIAIVNLASSAAPDSLRFVILGDRTGEAQPGVFEQVLREAAAQKPAFFAGVGDTIQGLKDATAEQEWKQISKTLAAYKRFPLYLAPGNHDVWSDRSAALFPKYAGHPLHYGFDYGPVHVTVLDNSRSDAMPDDELAFLEKDLQAHAAQPVKFILSHRPSWLINAAFGNTQFPLHQLAKRYGVKYVIAGHVHQMLHIDLDGVTYLSMPSSGGHLRGAMKYEDGWFFAYTTVDVNGKDVALQFHELKAPHGQGRVTTPKDWGKLGLNK
jgi:hypothetical protein